MHEYRQSETILGMMKKSGPHRPWEEQFDTFVTSAGDCYFNSGYLAQVMKTCEDENVNVLTLAGLRDCMATRATHFHPVYDQEGYLSCLLELAEIPRETVWHPQVLTEPTFRRYYALPDVTKRFHFIAKAVESGERFKLARPQIFFNVNFPEDLYRLRRCLEETC